MTLFIKNPDYTLAHADEESGYGLLHSTSLDDCVFLNPLATALWRAPVSDVDPDRDGRVFDEVFHIPGGVHYLGSVIRELAERGVLLDASGDGGPRPRPACRGDVAEARAAAPPLEQVYFYATKQCNARCYHCYQPTLTVEGPPRGPDESQLGAEDFLRFLETALPLGARGVKITGGEPLLRSDFRDIAGGARAMGLAVSVETNAFFLDENMADFLAESQIEVSVSLDGGSAEVHDKLRGLPGSFDRATRALRMMVERGAAPTTIMAISRRNLADVDNVVAAASSLGVQRVKFNPVNSLGTARRLQKSSVLLEVEEILDLYARRRELEERHGVFLFLEGPPSFATIHETITGHNAVCPFTRIIGVLADGSLSYCGVGNSFPELVFGSVTDEGFDSGCFWREAEPLVRARATVAGRLEGVCGLCVLEPYCRGSCRALAYGEFGSFKAPHPFCQKAYERGLFPAHYLRGGEELGRQRSAAQGV